MELRVPLYLLAYDSILLIALGYVWIFFMKRLRRYSKELKVFVQNAAFFLGIAVFGRLIDFLDNFISIPYDVEILTTCYFISIVGIIYTIVQYIITVEQTYMPTLNSQKIQKNEEVKSPGEAFLAFSSKNRALDVLEIINDLDSPTLIITRAPRFYEEFKNENILTLWVTQATDRGVSPTKLHVIQDFAINFAQKNPRAFVIIDCLEYIILYNGFETTFKFLVGLKDHLTLRGDTLILLIDKDALNVSQHSLLLKEFKPL
ncbi:hypothetical protein PAP_09985 [Palaeococcus pacificus DY20341]|uniref:DUF835 domain-containing protein n=1 Tax=Palaeococcus pacificus DY20341 TaxID=1343739 RepID=A0A075LVZ1_9EURY|nr:DUF835 domain-containing protein [Palaeococcus pacificus]AIF70371.1 hypothetical protein PAP_09985 [Palaeococcus pacificus DY20341]